jgi:hypothetical protein
MPKAKDDSEKIDEETPLLSSKRREWLDEFNDEPIGGVPGNKAFYGHVWLAFRCSFFATLLATIIWVPSMGAYVDQSWAQYIPLSVMMIFFTINPVFGSIIGNATAAISGTFFAVANIFILRGFFPDGVTREGGLSSPSNVIGWMDVMIFNFVFLATDLRMGVKMFAMGHNTSYMLTFLNPDDTSANWSKNFKINPNGTAVTCLKVTVTACCLTTLANLLPWPFGFAFSDMKVNARRVSAYVAKNFIGSLEYYQGSKQSVAIEKQIASTALVENEIATLDNAVAGAWYEGFDMGNLGTVRKLHEMHKSTMCELLDICKAIEIAIKTEDFAESHKTIMTAIGGAATELVDNAGELLMLVTSSAGDGDISLSEKADLKSKEEAVKGNIKALAKAFDDVRRRWDPVHKEVINESFFVFGLSAYGRKVYEYSEMMRTDPPMGESFVPMICRALKSTFTLEGVGDAHGAIAIRCWMALMLGFIYGVMVDNYTGACAVTIVFLQSTRVAPDVLATLNVLTAVAISSCCSAIIYARACEVHQYGTFVLTMSAFTFWWVMLYIHFSGSSFALIGLLSAALSPFVLVSHAL